MRDSSSQAERNMQAPREPEPESDVSPPPKASKVSTDPHVAALAELAALVDALAGQIPNAHAIQARIAALRARIEAL